ncbi:amino acid-binding ACT domain protein [Methylophaga frappieri]|uniref:Amino acid-binding ACT domain protein n=1 Tax=Methylophaga frappieri (strain ATCC BAA-2434 / DSM 25690 / JAM7) TaxID=754477 RepID=I1YLF9_METFJ|nr:ACT domain-containing protein [Methylophaga frappieri]AFJ03752.1 amino acid-binding ACT domain protein [Methylophaga frappieri]
MNKMLISVLGSDEPGIMAVVADSLRQENGNIENLSQTLLKDVFGALLMVSFPDDKSAQTVKTTLDHACINMNLFISVNPWNQQASEWQQNKPVTQPYIVTCIGPDRQGLVADVAKQLFIHGVNITDMQAIFRGGEDPMDNLMIFEVDVPKATVMDDLRLALADIANRLALEIHVQHRRIFESVSNILL